MVNYHGELGIDSKSKKLCFTTSARFRWLKSETSNIIKF